MIKRMSADGEKMLQFLIKYPDKWHSYGNDRKTLLAVAGLYFYRGLGVRGFEVSRHTHSMKLDKATFENTK